MLVFSNDSYAGLGGSIGCDGTLTGFDLAACTFLQRFDGKAGVAIKFETVKSEFNHNCPYALKIDNQDYDITMLYHFNFIVGGVEKTGRFIVQMMNWEKDFGAQNGRRITDLNLADLSLGDADKVEILLPILPAYREVTFDHVNYSAPMDWGKFFKAISNAVKGEKP